MGIGAALAKKKPRPAKKAAPAKAEDSTIVSGNRRTWTLILAILGLLTLALGLKAWDERQVADRAFLGRIDSEAGLLAARINARADAAAVVLQLVADGKLSKGEAASRTAGLDAIVTRADAAQSPDGSRLGDAAAAFAQSPQADAPYVLTRHGDIVLAAEAPSGGLYLAVLPISAIFEEPQNARLTLVSATTRFSFGAGNIDAAITSVTPGWPEMKTEPGGLRAANGCASVAGADFNICVAVERPLFTAADIVRLAILGLLIAAPAMALLGLTRRLSQRQTELLVQSTRQDESDRILGLVMRGARAGYWEWTPGSESIFFSDGAAEILGFTDPGLVSLDALMSRVPSEMHPRIREAFTAARNIGWIHLTLPVLSHAGRWIELRGSLSEDPASGAAVFGGIMLDVTERKQADDRSRAAEQRLRAAIEGFNGPFALWDQRRRLLYWNRAFALAFGLEDTLRPGMGNDTVQIARAGAVLLERQSAEDSQMTLIALRNGRWLKLVERPTQDGGLITVGIDVTENIRNEEELRQQQEKFKRAARDLERSEGRANELSRKYSEEKSKAERAALTKSAFLANMSHELRTPLNAIIGFSEVMMNELAGPLGHPSYKEYSRDILVSGQHLLDMINDILDMAKIESGKMTISPQPVDPLDPVDMAIRMVRRKAEEKEIDLKIEAPPNLPDIDADHRAIRQMILNLVSNAIKFTDRGGKITVRVFQHGPDMHFSVTDTGIGIPPEDIPRLGQPFEQVSKTKDRNTDGTGLGLALTKSFAEMHGGRLKIASIYGEGTTVEISLPIGGPESIGISSQKRGAA
jgi:two-component system, cell cycle sensor histidine kinase PleC